MHRISSALSHKPNLTIAPKVTNPKTQLFHQTYSTQSSDPSSLLKLQTRQFAKISSPSFSINNGFATSESKADKMSKPIFSLAFQDFSADMIKELKNEYPGVDFKELRKLTYDFGMINVAFSKTSNIELSESDSIKIMAILSKFGVSEKAFNVASGLNYLTVSHDMQDSSTQLDILSVNAFLMHFINRLKNERSVFYANDRLPLDCVDDMAEQSKYTPDQINKLCAAYHNAHAINALIKYIDSPVFLKCNKAIEHFNRARIYGCSDAENNIRAVELYRDISDEAESKKRTDEIYNIFSEKITALKPVIKDISTKSLDNIFRRFFVRVS